MIDPGRHNHHGIRSGRGPPLGQIAHHLFERKNGFPEALSTITVANPPTEESDPSSAVTIDVASESLSGARAMLCAPGTRLDAPRYSGRS